MSENNSSDDDSEPMMSSPDPSDDESRSKNKNGQDDDDDNDDVFHFKAQKFQKTTLNHSSPPSFRGLRSNYSYNSHNKHISMEDLVEEKVALIDRKRELRMKRLHKRVKRNNSDDDDDSLDSDNDTKRKITNATRTTGTQPSDVIDMTNPSFETTTAMMVNHGRTNGSYSNNSHLQKENIQDVVDLADSSEDEKRPPRYGYFSKEVNDILLRSQRAEAQLCQAQNYEAEDVHVKLQSPGKRLSSISYTINHTISQKTATTNLGKALHVKCRTRLTSGKKQEAPKQPTETIISVREHEPLQALSDRLLKALSLPPTADVVMTFDGMALVLARTPASYEMEEDDLIDVHITAICLSTTNNSNKNNTGPKIELVVRYKVGKKEHQHKLKLGQREPFEKLREMYQQKQPAPHGQRTKLTFHFDGEALDMQKTPVAYDMDSGDLIDVSYA